MPFFSGAFDDPNFDDREPPDRPRRHHLHRLPRDHARQRHRSATRAYTIEEPQHYPFAFSENPTLQWINNQLIKAKPDFHKKTFLKPFHKTAEFCSTCHKVRLPVELNHYKDFLRGQNHYDTFLLSGVSGHGARSFYYPPTGEEELRRLPHAARSRAATSARRTSTAPASASGHNHLFPGANTGLFALLKHEPRYKHHAAELRRRRSTKHADFLTRHRPGRARTRSCASTSSA